MIQTIILTEDDLTLESNQQLITDALKASKLVVFPTETVYGIGANALDPKASQLIYQTKGRPSDNPLIVHLAFKKDIFNYIESASLAATKLIDAFMPGPLTLIFKKNHVIPLETTGGLDTIAIRIPSNEIARKIIMHANLPVAAPSANLSGKPSSTEFKHVYADFYGKVDILIDGGQSEIGLESTVVDTTVEIPIILRPGFITQEMIEKVLGYQVLDLSNTRPTGEVKSPGMKYTHYKPLGEVLMIEGSIDAMASYVKEKQALHHDQKIAVICVEEYKKYFNCTVRSLGSMKNQKEMANNLFSALRDMDLWKMDLIYIHTLETHELGYAMMNRLTKASGYHVIKL
jgi:L-threonylcarbamoyladenylate synthase